MSRQQNQDFDLDLSPHDLKFIWDHPCLGATYITNLITIKQRVLHVRFRVDNSWDEDQQFDFDL